MTIPWSDKETRIVFRDSDNPNLVLEFSEFPVVGDIIAIDNFGVFRVVERGFLSGFSYQPTKFVAVNEVEGQRIAPGSNYTFLAPT